MWGLFLLLVLTVAIVGLDAFNGAHGYRKAMRLKAMIPTIDVRGGNNLEVTSGLKSAVDEKMGGIIERYGAQTTSASCTLRTVHSDLTQASKPTKVESHIAEVLLQMKGGAVLKSINIVAHELSAKLKKHKDRARTLKTKGGAAAKSANLPEVVDPEEPVFVDDFAEYEEDPLDTQSKINDFLGRK